MKMLYLLRFCHQILLLFISIDFNVNSIKVAEISAGRSIFDDTQSGENVKKKYQYVIFKVGNYSIIKIVKLFTNMEKIDSALALDIPCFGGPQNTVQNGMPDRPVIIWNPRVLRVRQRDPIESVRTPLYTQYKYSGPLYTPFGPPLEPDLRTLEQRIYVNKVMLIKQLQILYFYNLK